MNWQYWFRLRSFLKSSLWIVPFIAIIIEQISVRVLDRIDASFGWTFLDVNPSAAQLAYGVVITLTISFIGFTFGSLLVAIQVASGQLTPRIIATTLLRDNVVRFSVGLFVFSLLFATGAATRSYDEVKQLFLFTNSILGLGSIATFLFLIDYAARLLRPVAIVARVGAFGIEVIESLYPDAVQAVPTEPAPAHQSLGPPRRIVHHRGRSQIVLVVNPDKFVAEAQRTDGVIEFVPQVGDFVAVGEPIMRLYGGAADIDARRLRGAGVLGPERTLEQDPLFAFRILVDVAIKALSPAINDPTTAVLAIDQIHRLLRLVGMRNLRNERILDRAGQLRVILRTPNWEDFVHLAFTEIRHYGAGNVQVARRLRAMSENLIQALPEHRHAAVRRELELLDRALDKLFVFPEDLALARIADSQGLGAASGAKA